MTRAALALAAFAGLAACGPNLGMLVRDHHDREAVCGAHDRGGGKSAHIAAELADQAHPLVFVDEVPADQVARVAGDGPPLRARIVRVTVQTNILPLDALDAEVDVRGGAPAGWDALAALTGEPLPPQREVETYATPGNSLRVLAAFFTVGMSLPFTHFTPGTTLVDAPDEEYARVAPRAHALFHAMERTGCTDPAAWQGAGAGARCQWFFPVPPGRPIVLDLRLSFSADRLDLRGERSDGRCTITHAMTIEHGL